MNNIDKNIFENYASVEAALLNDLATEVRTKGKKARTLKGEKYYVKYDGVWHPVTPEQCRVHKLIRNNFNMFVEQLNSAKSDILGVWKNVWGDRLPSIIADLEKGIEICQKYFDAFEVYIKELEEKTGGNEENEAETEESAVEVTEAPETNSDKTETIGDMTEGAETNAETCVPKIGTQGRDQEDDEFVPFLRTNSKRGQDQEYDEGFVCKTQTNSTSRTAPRTTKTAPHEGTSSTTKKHSPRCPNFALKRRLTGFSIN